jgi:hypothetical protein
MAPYARSWRRNDGQERLDVRVPDDFREVLEQKYRKVRHTPWFDVRTQSA